jgi:uncharacterized protein (TIGR04255 family)
MPNTSNKSPSLVSLPSYEKPPVNEVVFGLRFNTPDQIRMPHVGLLWQKFQSDYPIIQHAAPIASAKGEIQIDTATGTPIPRFWFINLADDQLIQFQFDRFYFNWRRRESEYPRYDYVKNMFDRLYENVINFFDELNFGSFNPIECELTYINHIPKGEGWDTIEDASKIFTDFVWNYKETRFLPNPQKISWRSEFLFPDEKGRLTITLKHAIRSDDKSPIIVLELRTNGFCKSTNKKDILAWFDLAHDWIVKGFTDITTIEAQKIWRRI